MPGKWQRCLTPDCGRVCSTGICWKCLGFNSAQQMRFAVGRWPCITCGELCETGFCWACQSYPSEEAFRRRRSPENLLARAATARLVAEYLRERARLNGQAEEDWRGPAPRGRPRTGG